MDDVSIKLSSGLFFTVGDWGDGMAQVAIDADCDGDACVVAPDQAAFMLADLNRWILLDVDAANVWFANALRRAMVATAKPALLLAAE